MRDRSDLSRPKRMIPNEAEPYNPYAPPRAPRARPPAASPAGRTLATRGRRLAAALLDGLFDVAFQMSPAFALHGAGLDPFPRGSTRTAFSAFMPSGLLIQLCFLLPAAVQWTLIARSGQSLGKKAVGTCIVTRRGGRVGLVRGVIFRAGPEFALSLTGTALGVLHLPQLYSGVYAAVVAVLYLSDALFIFRRDVRCIHDHIAGTWVVRVGTGRKVRSRA
jgi:uncharacterized RDD family membrane protein YckC